MADLLNTSSVPLAPSASTTQTVLPDWYTNYAQSIIGQQQTAAATPYAPYQGPRVADFTPQQQAGFAATDAAAGSYAPALDAAGGALTNVQNGPTATSAAQPYLNQADQTASSQVGGYLNPYMQNVTDQIARQGNLNLTQNLLPAIGDQFVGAGGYGGSRQAEAIGKAIRSTQDDITSQQGAALASGYNSSLGAAQTDLARQGALGATAGNAAATTAATGINTAGALTSLGAQTQGLGLTGAGALTASGAQQQSLDQKNLDQAYQDFLAQRADPQAKINAETATLSGVAPAVPKGTLQEGYGPAPTGTTLSPTTLQGISSILGALGNLGLGS